MPKVYNKYKDTIPEGAVYVGRPGPFGNPFVIGRDGDRDAVVDKFRELVEAQDLFKAMIRRELKGKDLICHCKPERCHADVLLEIANS